MKYLRRIFESIGSEFMEAQLISYDDLLRDRIDLDKSIQYQ